MMNEWEGERPREPRFPPLNLAREYARPPGGGEGESTTVRGKPSGCYDGRRTGEVFCGSATWETLDDNG